MHTPDLSVMYEGGEFNTVLNRDNVPKIGDVFDLEIEGMTRRVVVVSTLRALATCSVLDQ